MFGIPYAQLDFTSPPNTALDQRVDLGPLNWDGGILIILLQSQPGIGVGAVSVKDDEGVNLTPGRSFDATHVSLIVTFGAIDGAAAYIVQTSPTQLWSGGAQPRGAGRGARKPRYLDIHIDALGAGIVSRASVVAEPTGPYEP